jgi:hypothetical protein
MSDSVAEVASSCIEAMLDAADNPDATFPAFFAVEMVIDAGATDDEAVCALFTAASGHLREALGVRPDPDLRRRVFPTFDRWLLLRDAWDAATRIIGRIEAQCRANPSSLAHFEELLDSVLAPETVALAPEQHHRFDRLHQWATLVSKMDVVLADLESVAATA